MILSIICPTYNEEKYIQKTIESFLKQQYHSFDLEILICDGMSTDKTREIVQSFSKQNPLIRLVDNPNRKTPYAFNIGLKEAKGDYVAILGAHSEYDDNYLQTCFEKLAEKNVVGCSGRIITKAASNNTQAKWSEWVNLSSFGVSGNSFRVIKEGYVHTIGYPVFKKQALLDVGGYIETLVRNQDNDMNQRLMDAGNRLYCTWDTQCYYRPPANINALLKYAEKNGLWNANSFFVNRKSMRLYHFIPFFFTLSLLALAIIGSIEKIILHSNYCWYLFIAIIVLHLIAGTLATLKSMLEEFDIRKIVLPFLFFAFHFSYGWGTIKGFRNRLN